MLGAQVRLAISEENESHHRDSANLQTGVNFLGK